MVDKVATTHQFALVDPLPKLFITGLLPNSTYGLLYIKLLPKFEYWLCGINKMATKIAATCHRAFFPYDQGPTFGPIPNHPPFS